MGRAIVLPTLWERRNVPQELLVRRSRGARGQARASRPGAAGRSRRALPQERTAPRRARGPLLPPPRAAAQGAARRRRSALRLSRLRLRPTGACIEVPGYDRLASERGRARLSAGRARPLSLDLDGRGGRGRPVAHSGLPTKTRSRAGPRAAPVPSPPTTCSSWRTSSTCRTSPSSTPPRSAATTPTPRSSTSAPSARQGHPRRQEH